MLILLSIYEFEGPGSGNGKCISCLIFNITKNWVFEKCEGVEYHDIYKFDVVAFDI